MKSKYSDPNATSSRGGSTTTQTTTPTTSTETVSSSAIENQQVNRMDPSSLAALQMLIQTLASGGTPQQQAEIAKKKQTQQLLEGLLGQYTTERAFSDAESLMALNLQQSMEKQMPAIQRAIEGAGTSASSMQALLSQQLARDASLAAGALGAEQAKTYGGITSSLTGQLSGLAANAMDPVTQTLINALNVAKGTSETTTGSRRSTQTGTTRSAGGDVVSTTTPISGQPSYSGTDIYESGATAEESAPLDPNRYYSQYGMSGGGQTLYDFLMNS